MTTLKAERRDMAVKAKKLRREGYVTGSVFGRELKESMPIRFSKKDADRLMKTCGKGSRIMLEVDGQQYNVLIKEIDFDALKRQINEIDFQALVQNEMVNSVAEILLLNHDKVQEGVLEQHLEEISYRALPASLVEKIEVTSRTTIREKLLTYLARQAEAAGSRTFTLPMSRTALAEYLCTDRSAMTRELAHMKAEGLIDYDKRQFTLYS